MLAPLAILGAVLLRRTRRPWALMLAPVVMVAFVSVTAYGFTRFRVAAEPALIVLAAVALTGAWGARRPWSVARLIGRVVLGAAAVIVLAWLAIMLRDVRIRADAQAGSLGALTADLHTTSGLRRRIDELRRSRLLDPDTAPQLQIASDLQVHGGAADARPGPDDRAGRHAAGSRRTWMRGSSRPPSIVTSATPPRPPERRRRSSDWTRGSAETAVPDP